MVKHCVELSAPYPRPINATLYRPGPKALEFGDVEIDEMLHTTNVEPAQW